MVYNLWFRLQGTTHTHTNKQILETHTNIDVYAVNGAVTHLSGVCFREAAEIEESGPVVVILPREQRLRRLSLITQTPTRNGQFSPIYAPLTTTEGDAETTSKIKGRKRAR